MKIFCIAGARPNFMKIAPLQRAFRQHQGIESHIVHTGQHYDSRMSDVFFQQLEIPEPTYHLGVGGGSHTQQTARIMLEFEKIVEADRPDLVVVVGDVNSTVACALVAAKMQIPMAHVEAGLRSGDRSMPEEINRILTDSISDHLFVTEYAGLVNLAKEGIPDRKVHFVGNCMIDSLAHFRPKAAQMGTAAALGLSPKSYVLMTMHRPSNVDAEAGLKAILSMVEGAAQHKKVVLPLHPRTRNNLEKFGLTARLAAVRNLLLLEPQGYLEFLDLMENAAAVLTDSGGIQEET
ncbi:MAG TPA: UDP-N-acetylglucosamine 2-epimerase (non-hydrolyzing), partial [Saprospiraceae bacterium]|nr:UDP-N-acetylglucosamine 2-epimerase (non-hydrolyzing) [Saprospiraceae bacterium]